MPFALVRLVEYVRGDEINVGLLLVVGTVTVMRNVDCEYLTYGFLGKHIIVLISYVFEWLGWKDDIDTFLTQFDLLSSV